MTLTELQHLSEKVTVSSARRLLCGIISHGKLTTDLKLQNTVRGIYGSKPTAEELKDLARFASNSTNGSVGMPIWTRNTGISSNDVITVTYKAGDPISLPIIGDERDNDPLLITFGSMTRTFSPNREVDSTDEGFTISDNGTGWVISAQYAN